jgi:hypothetical protein
MVTRASRGGCPFSRADLDRSVLEPPSQGQIACHWIYLGADRPAWAALTAGRADLEPASRSLDWLGPSLGEEGLDLGRLARVGLRQRGPRRLLRALAAERANAQERRQTDEQREEVRAHR